MTRFLVTPSLLNSWLYVTYGPESLREREADEVCIEDKRQDASEAYMREFLAYLNKEPRPTTEAQQRGIDFEEATYRGETPASPYVEGGAWQIAGSKPIDAGLPFLLYGRLDCLKGGIIYDIKRVSRYYPGKYLNSAQHPAYLALFPEAREFDYLAFDGNRLHIERYPREDVKPIDGLLRDFALFLKSERLLGVYQEKWRAR